ncbi:unnamed protein product [Peronospora belbahrii]|nr:unnamed protein product [Peronospora belbahrii]
MDRYETDVGRPLSDLHRVMSPNEDTIADDEGSQRPRADVCREMADAQGENLEVNEDRANTPKQLPDLLVGLNKRMDRMEASQEKAMGSDASDVTPPRRVSPAVSPNTYSSVHQRGFADAAANVK